MWFLVETCNKAVVVDASWLSGYDGCCEACAAGEVIRVLRTIDVRPRLIDRHVLSKAGLRVDESRYVDGADQVGIGEIMMRSGEFVGPTLTMNGHGAVYHHVALTDCDQGFDCGIVLLPSKVV